MAALGVQTHSHVYSLTFWYSPAARMSKAKKKTPRNPEGSYTPVATIYFRPFLRHPFHPTCHLPGPKKKSSTFKPTRRQRRGTLTTPFSTPSVRRKTNLGGGNNSFCFETLRKIYQKIQDGPLLELKYGPLVSLIGVK